jgi:hypothetical protein
MLSIFPVPLVFHVIVIFSPAPMARKNTAVGGEQGEGAD